MRRLLIFFFLGLGLLLAGVQSAGAKNIILETGETYQDDGLNVMCVGSKTAAPVKLKECQYWDEFNKSCLFEKKIYLYGDLECLEKCQHWDKFNNHCDYATTCTFYPSQKLFVLETCDEFDTFKQKCIRTKKSKIIGK